MSGILFQITPSVSLSFLACGWCTWYENILVITYVPEEFTTGLQSPSDLLSEKLTYVCTCIVHARILHMKIPCYVGVTDNPSLGCTQPRKLVLLLGRDHMAIDVYEQENKHLLQ